MFEKVRKVLAENLRIDEAEIKPESKILEDLGADSLNLVELIMYIEDEYNVEVPDEVTETFITVQDVVNYMETL